MPYQYACSKFDATLLIGISIEYKLKVAVM